ncbi:MAG: crossover junction endodeoxyribonuclease RuvC [Ignavibacterium sp.]|jgi:crossover junction endodeoxyribonuclease RuvC
MIILGVDPGTLVTGYGVIEQRNGGARVLAYDVVKNRSTRSMPLRLKAIYTTLCDVIERYHPDEFAIETAFYGRNAQSALKIGHARGVSILAAVNSEIPTAEYSPREIKKAVVGNGAASKEQVQAMVRRLLDIAPSRKKSRLFDATDALAVALCHLQRRGSVAQSRRKRTRPTENNAWKAFLAKHPERVLQQP